MFRRRTQTSPHRVHSSVRDVHFVVVPVANAMISETLLPDFQVSKALLPGGVREPALDELNCALYRDVYWRQNGVQVIGHDYEFVKQILSFRAVMKKSRDEKFG